MSRIAYVNGAYRPLRAAQVHIEDRGYQFADGVYEVCVVINGAYWDMAGHLNRLQRSLSALEIPAPMSRASLEIVMAEMIKRNRLSSALVYIQVTRGVGARNHVYAQGDLDPVLVMTARRFDIHQSDAKAAEGARVITAPDIRWGRVDIKTIGLLPNAMAKTQAARAGAAEAMLVRDGVVTECTSSNAWIVDADGALITHPKSDAILGGITRETAIACAEELQIKVIERAFTVAEAKAAREAFFTSASSFVMPIISIDGSELGGGKPGPVTTRLREAYKARAIQLAES